MNKKVLILGIDGYIGWALANELASKDYEVYGVDNFWRRENVKSLFPISSIDHREEQLRVYRNDIRDPNILELLLLKYS